MIEIPNSIVEHLYRQAEETAPAEACGYLAGQENHVMRYYPMRNMDQSPDHFTLDPAEQFEIMKSARKGGFKILAVYHSHPQTAARPSEEDIRLAFDPNILYVIVSLADQKKDIQAFKIKNQVVSMERVEIV